MAENALGAAADRAQLAAALAAGRTQRCPVMLEASRWAWAQFQRLAAKRPPRDAENAATHRKDLQAMLELAVSCADKTAPYFHAKLAPSKPFDLPASIPIASLSDQQLVVLISRLEGTAKNPSAKWPH